MTARPYMRLVYLLLLLPGIAGFALRAWDLDGEGLWLDELQSALHARAPSPGALLEGLRYDVHPPGYYALLWGWARLFGDSELSLRALSVLSGVALIGLVAGLTRRLLGEVAAGIAAWLVALAPFLVELSREARGNMPMAAALVGLAIVVDISREGEATPRARLLGVGLGALGVASLHPFGVFGVGWLALWLLLEDWEKARRRTLEVGGALLLGAAAIVPWYLYISPATSHAMARSWYLAPSPDSLGWLLPELAGGYPGPLVLIGVGVGLLLLRAPEEEAAASVLTLLLTAVGALVLVPQALSYLATPLLRDRSVAALLVPILIASAAGLTGLSPRRVRAASAVLVCMSLLLVTTRQVLGTREKEQWREAAALVQSQWRPGQRVVANHPNLWRYYLPELPLVGLPAGGEELGPWIQAQGWASGRLWLLNGHTEREWVDATALAADRGWVLADHTFRGAHVALIGFGVRALDLDQVQVPSPAMKEGGRLHFYWEATTTLPSVVVSGGCQIGVKGRAELARGEGARLKVELQEGTGTPLVSGEVLLGEEEGTHWVGPTRSGEGALRLSFLNDERVPLPGGGREDRNAHVSALLLDCP